MDVGLFCESVLTRAVCFVDIGTALRSKYQIPVLFSSALHSHTPTILYFFPGSVLDKDTTLDLTKHVSYSSQSLKPSIKQMLGTGLLRVKRKGRLILLCILSVAMGKKTFPDVGHAGVYLTRHHSSGPHLSALVTSPPLIVNTMN